MQRNAEMRTTWCRPWCESAATAVGLSWVAMPACHAALQEQARTHRFGTCLTTERGVHIEHPCSKWAAAFGSSGGSQAVTWSRRSTRAQSSPGRCELIATTGPRQGGRGARQCRVAALTVEHIVVVHRRPLRLLKILCFPPVVRLAEQNGKQQSSTSHLAARAQAPPQSGRAPGSHEVCEAAGRNETVHRCQLEGALDQLQGAWGLDAAGDARRTRPARMLAVKSLIADPPAPPRRHARDTTGLEETHWNGPPRREGSGVSSRKRGRGHHSPL